MKITSLRMFWFGIGVLGTFLYLLPPCSLRSSSSDTFSPAAMEVMVTELKAREYLRDLEVSRLQELLRKRAVPKTVPLQVQKGTSPPQSTPVAALITKTPLPVVGTVTQPQHVSQQMKTTTTETFTISLCEDEQRFISCGSGWGTTPRVIHIVKTFYGRSDSTTCAMPGQNIDRWKSKCGVSMDGFFREQCDGKPVCIVSSRSDLPARMPSKDPCEFTPKYLTVSYTCVLPPNTTPKPPPVVSMASFLQVDAAGREANRFHNILYIQSHHEPSIIDGEHGLTQRNICWCKRHGYTYAVNVGDKVYDEHFAHRAGWQHIRKPTFWWSRAFQFVAALESPDAFLNRSSYVVLSDRISKTPPKERKFHWILYTDRDNQVMESSIPLEAMVRTWNKQSGEDCWAFVQDYEDGTTNSGWVLLRNSVNATRLANLWIEQWQEHQSDEYQDDQGPLQEAISLWVSSLNSVDRFGRIRHYEKDKCWKRPTRQDKTVCYATTFKNWGLMTGRRTIHGSGLCFLRAGNRFPNENVNAHQMPADHHTFIHMTFLKQRPVVDSIMAGTKVIESEFGRLTRNAPIWNDTTCPLTTYSSL